MISKCELHARRKYVIEGRSSLYQAHRAINLLEFREKVQMEALSKFSGVFGLIDETYLDLCGYKLLGGRRRTHVQSIIVCLRAGEKLEGD